MSYEGRLNRRNWSSSDRTWLKIKRGCRSDAFNANRPRIAGSKIIHVGEVSPAVLFARAGVYGASPYAYGHAFARKFQLNFICGVVIESPPNHPPAINPPFPRFNWPRLQVKVRGPDGKFVARSKGIKRKREILSRDRAKKGKKNYYLIISPS